MIGRLPLVLRSVQSTLKTPRSQFLLNTTAVTPVRHGSSMKSSSPCVAVLHQAIPPPVVNNVRKPIKPGGYRDSSADIAFSLRDTGVKVVTPREDPRADCDEDWSFADTEEGILTAIKDGATCIWANTILFDEHPLQASTQLTGYGQAVTVVGQPPTFVQLYDDKNVVNNMLREAGGFNMPRSYIVTAENLNALDLPLPAIGKPIRGRGSHGVQLCRDRAVLRQHVLALLEESPEVMIEEYLTGQETTVTVMPPSKDSDYWALPVVERFNHEHGIAPYSGKTAVTANSRVITTDEFSQDEAYTDLVQQCVRAARLLRTTAPIRIDARRYKAGEPFALFDINMKPNMTGPGRPGREDQSSLTAIAAAGLGWTYSDLLRSILETATPLHLLRKMRPMAG